MEYPNDPPESSSPEILRLRDIPGELGFIESDDMTTVREQALLVNDPAELIALTARYSELGESVVEQQPSEIYPRAQLGLMIATGMLRRDTGRIADAQGDIMAAFVVAEGLEIEGIRLDIEKVLTAELASILRPRDDFDFDQEMCDEIATLSFDDALYATYGNLVLTDLDANEILAPFFEL